VTTVTAELAVGLVETLPPVPPTPATPAAPAVAPPASKDAELLARLHAPIGKAPTAIATTAPQRHRPGSAPPFLMDL